MLDVNNTLDPKDVLTPEELAQRLKVRVGWIYEKSRARGQHASAKPLPCLHMGRYIRFYWPDVCDWMRNGSK
jgi:hypothetical protein